MESVLKVVVGTAPLALAGTRAERVRLDMVHGFKGLRN
jgi:hypothetical protein